MDSTWRPCGDFCRRRGLAAAPACPRRRKTPSARAAIRSKARKAQKEAQKRKRRRRAPAFDAPVAEQVKQEVNSNLDSLKDTLLRIELRRQAGTISDEEYARERGNAEQMLRDLVQG